MLALLTLSMAGAEQVELDAVALGPDVASQARASLLEATATCCVVELQEVDTMNSALGTPRNLLRMALGHTRRGQVEFLGGTALSQQLVALDSVPLMIGGQMAPFYQRTGTTAARHNVRPLGQPMVPGTYW